MSENVFAPVVETLTRQLLEIEEMAYAVMGLGVLLGELADAKLDPEPGEELLIDDTRVIGGIHLSLKFIAELQEWKLQDIRDGLKLLVPTAQGEGVQ